MISVIHFLLSNRLLHYNLETLTLCIPFHWATIFVSDNHDTSSINHHNKLATAAPSDAL